KLAKHGLKVAVFRGDTDLSRPGSIDEMATQLATCEKMGVRYMFLSPKHKTVSKEVAIERLKKIGDVAKKHNVIIGLETHPDLGTNGDVHVATMKAIDHPNIRVNYDCANITYYNEGADTVTELKKCIDYVGTFEFKDHDLKLKSWCFPALGEGKVDIPGVLKVLVAHGYRGPITLEIEGTEGVKRTPKQIKDEIARSAKYIRSLRKFD
ncbi:MAG: sugar phosphate isomerase/epimerase family protein, partial [Planctomycetota bacterium]|nr:sugar phosphate isomerase/epimerase family protein [Planctomycetota bacterium]